MWVSSGFSVPPTRIRKPHAVHKRILKTRVGGEAHMFNLGHWSGSESNINFAPRSAVLPAEITRSRAISSKPILTALSTRT